MCVYLYIFITHRDSIFLVKSLLKNTQQFSGPLKFTAGPAASINELYLEWL